MQGTAEAQARRELSDSHELRRLSQSVCHAAVAKSIDISRLPYVRKSGRSNSMKKRLPPLNPLRAFEATARHRSLTLAAARAQRHARGRQPSDPNAGAHPQGQALRARRQAPQAHTQRRGAASRSLLRLRRHSRRDRAPDAPAMSGEFAVSCVPAVLSLWLIPRLRGFIGAVSRREAPVDRVERRGATCARPTSTSASTTATATGATAGTGNGPTCCCSPSSARR